MCSVGHIIPVVFIRNWQQVHKKIYRFEIPWLVAILRTKFPKEQILVHKTAISCATQNSRINAQGEHKCKPREHHLNTKYAYCPVFRWLLFSGVQYSDGYCKTHRFQFRFQSCICRAWSPLLRRWKSCWTRAERPCTPPMGQKLCESDQG